MYKEFKYIFYHDCAPTTLVVTISRDYYISAEERSADLCVFIGKIQQGNVRIPAGRTGWLPVYGEVSDKKGAYWVDVKFNEIDYNDKADEVSAEWDNASFKS